MIVVAVRCLFDVVGKLRHWPFFCGNNLHQGTNKMLDGDDVLFSTFWQPGSGTWPACTGGRPPIRQPRMKYKRGVLGCPRTLDSGRFREHPSSRKPTQQCTMLTLPRLPALQVPLPSSRAFFSCRPSLARRDMWILCLRQESRYDCRMRWILSFIASGRVGRTANHSAMP